MPKQIKAPEWLIELMQEAESTRNESTALLGVSPQWIEQASMEAFVHHMDENVSRVDKERAIRLVDSAKLITSHAWARLRYEFKDDDLAYGYLSFDDKKGIIKLGESPLSKFTNGLKDLAHKTLGVDIG